MIRELLVVAVLAALPGSAVAQSEIGKGIPPAVDAASKVSDAQTFVDRAALSGIFEIRSGELALQKSKDAQVLRFAKRMIADHKATADRLRAAAAQAELLLTLPSEVDVSHAEEMDQLRGATTEFDALYVKQQVATHDEAIALFKAYSTKGDNDVLKTFAIQTLPQLIEHRQMLM